MMKLTVTYKNGNELTNDINWLELKNNSIRFTVNRRVHSLGVDIVSIPLENIATYRIEEV